MTATVIYHIATTHDWDAAQHDGVYRPASLGAEGFIHCSTRAQVLGTAERYYHGVDGLWLLRIDAQALGDALRYEPPAAPDRAHERFPHLYAALPLGAVQTATPFPSRPDGSFAWPDGA